MPKRLFGNLPLKMHFRMFLKMNPVNLFISPEFFESDFSVNRDRLTELDNEEFILYIIKSSMFSQKGMSASSYNLNLHEPSAKAKEQLVFPANHSF